jgi:hypothetical protein
MMDQPLLTCELVDQRELDRRYVAGELEEEEAAAFEEHFFGCDRCWGLVRAGAGVRAAPARRVPAAAPARRAWWKPLALAAGLGVLAFGASRLADPGNTVDPNALRGGEDGVAVAIQLSGGRWQVAWSPVPGAASYRVRVFTEAGGLVITRELGDTALKLPADSLTALAQGGVLYLEVQGADALRRQLARSPLTPLLPPGASR